MCSQRMENYQGDLTDIIRATGSSIVGGGDGDDGSNATPIPTAETSSSAVPEWLFPTDPISYSAEDFGDPFGHLRDPLLNDIDTPVSGFFSNSNNMIKAGNIVETEGKSTGGFSGGGMKRPAPNMFSRMLQISPNAKLPMGLCDSPAVASPRVLKGTHPPMLVANHDHGLISPNSSKSNCLVESQGLQISSPRNTGIKRRKSQAKKVVCIPAPAPANSRPSGEVVPSDLWAWRKYGQKPIKGSPYPRGYYRCSSSKGCSARKQVERSRNDPNMLVITYTSEHNHPWPTQRNALAGSTRATPSKNAGGGGTKDTQTQKPTNPKEEHKETTTENTTPPPSAMDAINVKEENTDIDHNHLEKNNMEDTDQFERGFPNSYKPTLPDSNQSEDNFFADLGEIEADSLDMLFTQGFSGDDGGEDKTLDPFTFYDWAGSNSTTAAASSGATTSYGDPTKRDS